MQDIHFNARSRSGSSWGGVVKGSAARCAQRQFAAGATEVEVVGEHGRSILRPGEQIQVASPRPVEVPCDPVAMPASAVNRRRIALRIGFWLISLTAIGLVTGAVVTISSAKVAVTEKATAALRAKVQEGVVESTLSDMDWEDGLVYRFQVLLDGKPAMNASYDVLGGKVRLGR